MHLGRLADDTEIVRFYTSGNFYSNLPVEVRDLPVDLMRSRAYPRRPEVLEEGIEQYPGARPVFYAPQGAGFTRWKTPPTQTAFGQNMVSLLGALRHGLEVQRRAHVHEVPVLDYDQAPGALGANRLPQPTDNLDRNLRRGYVPLSPGVVPLDDVINPEQVMVAAQDAGAAEDLRNDARASALQSIGAYQDRVQMLMMHNAGAPWFMKG